MSAAAPLHLFTGFGIELEYMIVQADTLEVLPVADQLLHAVAGEYAAEVDMGPVAWSNELALHVIEIKTNGPAPSLLGLPHTFQAQLAHINTLLQPLGGCLLPSGMHPWMEPHRDMRLWPHEYNPVYEAFNRIFNCQGHGWANLQSVHLNLPFADDAEFGQLHAAIRLLLPILPALAASSPLVEGRLTGYLDTRLEVYRTNAQRVPSVTAQVIPEPVFTRHDYERDILARLYRDIAPYDPEAILQEEWLNARGAIARFDRHTIEIRVLDVQECPWADVAICAAIVEVLSAMIAERWCSLGQQQAWPIEPLSAILLDVIQHADLAVINRPQYLQAFGFPDGPRCTAGELWQYLLETSRVLETQPDWTQPLQTIVQHGPLARRVRRAVQDEPTRGRIRTVYQALQHCLATGTVFVNCP